MTSPAERIMVHKKDVFHIAIIEFNGMTTEEMCAELRICEQGILDRGFVNVTVNTTDVGGNFSIFFNGDRMETQKQADVRARCKETATKQAVAWLQNKEAEERRMLAELKMRYEHEDEDEKRDAS